MFLPDNTKRSKFPNWYFLACIVVGGLLIIGVILTLNLPAKITMGEKAQKAIQALDEIRRPFLKIKDAENRLVKTGNSETAFKDFTKAIELSNSLFDRYLKVSLYNPEVHRLVKQMRLEFEKWVDVERHFFKLFEEAIKDKSDSEKNEHFREALSKISFGFMSTMNKLGDGEVPIHNDMDAGDKATRLLIALSGLYFLCLIGLMFFYQAFKKRELNQSYNKLQKEVEERKLMEEALSKSENGLNASQEQLRAIIDNSTAVIYLKDIDGQYLLINKQYEKLFHVTERGIVGKTDYDVFPKEVADRLRNNDLSIIKTKVSKEYEEVVPQADGLHTYISIKFPICDALGKVYGVSGISTDITTRKKMEEDIAESQKLESLGLLAGGIAHDFNNILAIVLNGMSYIEKHGRLEGKALKNLEDTRNVAVRAKGLTQQLLTFSKGGDPVRKTASISLLLKDGIDFFLSGSNIRCDLSIQNDLWPAEVDKGQVGQVINNLIINAEQAMPDGGVLEVYAENIELKTDKFLTLPGGRYLKILIRDYGVGIAKGNVQKIFDPYFTTKEGGTGLGLTTTYSIIKKHGGHISVDSEVGVGTTFTIYLPASDKELVVEEKSFEKSSVRQKPKVLLMEDEERLGKVVRDLLKYIGYDVDLTKDGSEAIEVFQKAWNSKQPFDAVVMDLTIQGGMGGKEAIKRLIEIDPNVKAIVTSGYSNDPVMANFKDYGFSGVIPKPYDADELSEKLCEILAISDK